MGENKRKSASTYDNSFKEIEFFDRKLIFRQPKLHRISIDLVLFISKLRGIKRNSKVIDLGAGFGFLSVVIAKLYKCEVIAIERDPFLYSLLEYNIGTNRLSSKITPVMGDIKNISKLIEKGVCDVCVINPPFYRGQSSNHAHWESDTTLKHFIEASSYSLRDGGYLNIFFLPNRIYELFCTMNKVNIHPFYMCFLFPFENRNPKRIIVSGRKNIMGLVEIDKAFFINDKEGKYSYQTTAILKVLSDRL